MLTLARLIRTIAGIVVFVIVVAILLAVFSANPHSTVVSDIHDAGKWLVGPFANLFTLKNLKVAIAVNWGIAAAVYLVVGHALAAMLARHAPRGLRRHGFRRRWPRPIA